MSKKMKTGVEVIERKTAKVVEFIDCHGKGRDFCEQVEGGTRINFNHENYYTRIVCPKKKRAK